MPLSRNVIRSSSGSSVVITTLPGTSLSCRGTAISTSYVSLSETANQNAAAKAINPISVSVPRVHIRRRAARVVCDKVSRVCENEGTLTAEIIEVLKPEAFRLEERWLCDQTQVSHLWQLQV